MSEIRYATFEDKNYHAMISEEVKWRNVNRHMVDIIEPATKLCYLTEEGYKTTLFYTEAYHG